jgi:hypothetical protein
MIKALILDFGGVVVTMPPDAPSARAVAAELDLPVNVEAAAALGIHAIPFQNEAQAIAAIRQRLALDGAIGS